MLNFIRPLCFSWHHALKLLAGDDEKLLQIIPVLIGCTKEDVLEGNSIETAKVREILDLMKDKTFSHLMEILLGTCHSSSTFSCKESRSNGVDLGGTWFEIYESA